MGSGGSGAAGGGGTSGTGGAQGWGGTDSSRSNTPGGSGYGGDLGGYGTAGEMSGGAGGAGMAGFGGGGLAGVAGSGFGGSRNGIGGYAGRQQGIIGQGTSFGTAAMAPGWSRNPQTGAIRFVGSSGVAPQSHPGYTVSARPLTRPRSEKSWFATTYTPVQTNPLTIRPGSAIAPILTPDRNYRTRPGIDPGMGISPNTLMQNRNSFGRGNLTGPAPGSGSTAGPNRGAKGGYGGGSTKGNPSPRGGPGGPGYRGF